VFIHHEIRVYLRISVQNLLSVEHFVIKWFRYEHESVRAQVDKGGDLP
jgi:hypothetical protein